MSPNHLIPFSLPLRPMLSSFLLSFFFFDLLSIPPCQFCSSTVEHLVDASCCRSHWTFNHSNTYSAAHDVSSYCGHYSLIGSSFLELALIPLWTPHWSSNHTIYTAPLTVTSLERPSIPLMLHFVPPSHSHVTGPQT